MKFKHPELLAELERCPEALQKLVALFAWIHKQVSGKDPVITCVLGDANGRQSLTHKEGRAVDARIETVGDFNRPAFYVTEEQAAEIAARVNKAYPLSAGAMQACVVHRAEWLEGEVRHTGKLHFHCQVSRGQVKPDEELS